MTYRSIKWFIPVAGGLFASLMVYVGTAAHWSGFSVDTGYWGTYYLDGLLYALGDRSKALRVLAVVWFTYGFVACIVLQLVVEKFRKPKRNSTG
jgi:hypothetical protein